MTHRGRVVFCTGGCRSGKSSYALSLADNGGPAKVFVATLVPQDSEMRERVRRHQGERGDGWNVVEVALSNALSFSGIMASISSDVVVVDCLSTWVSACQEVLLGKDSDAGATRPVEAEALVLKEFAAALNILRQSCSLVVLVSAETGLGLVPETSAGRVFRDILGKVNQLAAKEADEACFLISGLPIRLK